MNTAALTFAAFQASGRAVADLRAAHPEFAAQYHPAPVPGRLYTDGGLYLQADGDGWYVEFGMAYLAGDLAACEAFLYAVYLSEVVGAEHPQYDALRAAAPANRYWRT